MVECTMNWGGNSLGKCTVVVMLSVLVSIQRRVGCRINQKGIIVGKNGEMIKKISMRSRHELETMWNMNVSLYCEVEVLPNWRNDPRKLAKVGYGNKERN